MDIPTDWTFRNTAVASGFDQHVREQLPWYDLVTGAVAHIVRHYMPENGLIYDIGASTGNIGRSVQDTISTRSARLIAIESSKQMADMYTGPGDLVVADAMSYEYDFFDVAVLFLCLTFMPVANRKQFTDELSKKVKPGGCIIIFDKMVQPSGYLGTVMHRLTIAGKVAAGVNSDSIIAKELSLAGVQRPLTDWFIESLTPKATRVFQFGEFAGFILEYKG